MKNNTMYRQTANGYVECTTLEMPIGKKIFGEYGTAFCHAGIFYICSEPDERGQQMMVEAGGKHRIMNYNSKDTVPISEKFGIGTYYDDAEDSKLATEEDLKRYLAEAIVQKEIEKRNKEKAQRKRDRKIKSTLWQYNFLTPITNMNWDESRKQTKRNLCKLLKHEFPGTKFSVSTSDRNKVSWSDGPSLNDVAKVVYMFLIPCNIRMDDYHEHNPTIFNDLFGGYTSVFSLYRNEERKQIC